MMPPDPDAFVPAPQGCPADARRIGEPPRNADAMASFAREIRVAPGIVPGRLRKIGVDRVVPA